MESGIVLENSLVAVDVYLMRILAPSVVERARPGHFLMLHAPSMQVLLPRAMAPIRFNADGSTDVYYRVVGPGTQQMAEIARSPITVTGPLGREVKPEPGDLAVIGRGVGITPLLPLAEAASRTGRGVRSYLSARVPDLLLDAGEFHALGPVACHSDSEQPGRLVTEQLERDLAAGWRPVHVVVAGSRRLARAVARLQERYGFRAEVFVEEKMACGIGFCKGCPIGRERALICVEGPALPIEEVMAEWQR